MHVEDALGCDLPEERSEVTAWVRSVAPRGSCIDRDWSHTISRIKQQMLGTDCEIFVLVDMMCIADDYDASAVQ
eukprot:3606733-Rhodomonas_salina.2